MSLNVETGQGGADSESYASVTDADTYFAARGFALWASEMSTTEKEQALRRGTEYMQAYYNGRWKGEKYSCTQALDWPRYAVVVDGFELEYDNIPTQLKNACIKLAYKAAGGDLVPDLDRPTTSEKVGEIAVSYAPGARQQVRYQEIDNMLTVYLSSSGSMAKVMRA
jgi:hypothetical protein